MDSAARAQAELNAGSWPPERCCNVRRFAVLVALLWTFAQPAAQSAKPLEVYFIDVEGGQATLIVTPAGESMLIDTGYPGFEDRDLNRVLATITLGCLLGLLLRVVGARSALGWRELALLGL